jgi:hypothetical protein
MDGMKVCFERSPDDAHVCHRIKGHEMPHRGNGWEWGYTPCEATFQGSECEKPCGHPGLHSTTIGWADRAYELTYAVEVCRLAGLRVGTFYSPSGDGMDLLFNDYKKPCPACGQPLDAHGDGLGQISEAGCARVAALPPEVRR